ncbi:MAG: hypothetical protein WD023_09505 [Ilumatobacteraceae bacterium]
MDVHPVHWCGPTTAGATLHGEQTTENRRLGGRHQCSNDHPTRLAILLHRSQGDYLRGPDETWSEQGDDDHQMAA